MASRRSNMPNITLLINKQSKWHKELTELCSQGYNTISVSNFNQNLDVMIQSKPKQIVSVLNGADLLFEWKRNDEIKRIKEVATYFKHSYVVIVCECVSPISFFAISYQMIRLLNTT